MRVYEVTITRGRQWHRYKIASSSPAFAIKQCTDGLKTHHGDLVRIELADLGAERRTPGRPPGPRRPELIAAQRIPRVFEPASGIEG